MVIITQLSQATASADRVFEILDTKSDITDKPEAIALPAVKVSIQAVTLQMAAEKAFGEGQQGKLDALTVSLSHPDAQVALLSGASEITAHFGSPPFQYQQLEKPGIRTVLNSYDVAGGRHTLGWKLDAGNAIEETLRRFFALLMRKAGGV